jgi:hypothetical protein
VELIAAMMSRPEELGLESEFERQERHAPFHGGMNCRR